MHCVDCGNKLVEGSDCAFCLERQKTEGVAIGFSDEDLVAIIEKAMYYRGRVHDNHSTLATKLHVLALAARALRSYRYDA